jgi:hypothetical protein
MLFADWLYKVEKKRTRKEHLFCSHHSLVEWQRRKKKWREIYWCWCHALLYSLIASRSSFAYVDLVKQQQNILPTDDVSLYQTFEDNQ